MFKSIVLAGTALIAAGAPTFAADLPVYKAPAVVVAAAPAGWAGCYVGFSGGADFARFRPSVSSRVGPAANLGVGYVSAGQIDKGFTGGDFAGRLGCQWQTHRLVWGLEGETGRLGLQTRASVLTTPYQDVPAGYPAFGILDTQTTGGFFAVASLKAGFAVTDSLLLFAKAGVGYLDLRTRYTDPIGVLDATISNSGFIPKLGAGVEFKLSEPLSLTAEYAYVRPPCGSGRLAYPGVGVTPRGGFTTFTSADVRQCFDKHMLSVGLNYRFYTPTAPIR